MYAPNLSAFSASYQKNARRYLAFGSSSAPAQLRTLATAALTSQARSRSASGNEVLPLTRLSSWGPELAFSCSSTQACASSTSHCSRSKMYACTVIPSSPSSLPTVAWMPLSSAPMLMVRKESSWKSPGLRTRMRIVFSVTSGAGLASLALSTSVAKFMPNTTLLYSHNRNSFSSLTVRSLLSGPSSLTNSVRIASYPIDDSGA